MCGGCEVNSDDTVYGSIEVALTQPTGSRNLSHIGESTTYPTGHGCEMCN
ncbi:hypothetical protein SEA_ZIZZLE_41 [Mycobacterium phage Zizzle]|nr:hypothetical protein SEA_ZIZZLE_41 [Mycobacterium phage Zizzle]